MHLSSLADQREAPPFGAAEPGGRALPEPGTHLRSRSQCGRAERLIALALMGFAAVVGGQAAESSALPPNLPILKRAVQIQAAGKVLSVGHTCCPEVIDWNNDGKKDLLVGTFENGKVMLFLNRGTDAEPQFDEGRPLRAGGKDIHVGFG